MLLLRKSLEVRYTQNDSNNKNPIYPTWGLGRKDVCNITNNKDVVSD